MKKILSLFVLLVFCTAANAVTYPTLEQVATKLYGNYSVPEYEIGEEVRYHKKREGWFVVHAIYNKVTEEYDVKEEELFWSTASGKYKILKMFPTGITVGYSRRIASDLRYASAYDFERCPYFGYDGWDQDVITDFGSTTSSNDTIMEGLARAYSNFAQGYLTHQYSFHVKSQMNLPEQERIDLFIANEKKAIAIYDVLRKRNPHYEVLIGEVTTKYSNEIMATYETLLYYGRESEMKSYFSEELYDPLMRSIALSMLEACNTNGILFTNGDNDSYPLWYLQWIKGIRTDVAVINLSLLNLNNYILRYRNGFQKVQPVKMTIDQVHYAREDVFFKGEGSGKRKVTGAEFLTKMMYDDNERVNGDTLRCYIPCKIVLHRPKSMFADYELLEEEDSVLLSFDRYYLTNSEMAMVDIILTNYESRAVYVTASSDLFSGINEYFFIEGVVKRFIPGKERVNTSEMHWMGPVASAKIFQKKMIAAMPKDTTCNDRVNGGHWVTNYKICGIYAGEMLLATDKSAAKKMLDLTYAKFPSSNWKAKSIDVYAVKVYYSAGDATSGDALGVKLMEQMESDLRGFDQKGKLSDDEKNDRERCITVLKMLKDTFDQNQRAALSGRTQKILDKY